MISNIAIALTFLLPYFYLLFQRNLILVFIYLILYIIAFYIGSNKLIKIIFNRLLDNQKYTNNQIELTYIYLWLLSNIPIILSYRNLNILAFIMVLIYLVINYYLKKLVTDLTIKYQKRNKTITNYLEESYLGKDTITNKKTDKMRSRMFNHYLERYQKSLNRYLFLNYFIYLFNFIYILLILFIIKDFNFTNMIVLGYLLIYVYYFLTNILKFKNYLLSIHRRKANDKTLIKDFKEINIKNLNIANLFTKLNLKIKKGEMLYIIKEKKEYANLLNTSYEGKISIDKKDLKKINISNILEIVPKDIWFKKTTIIDNLLYQKNLSFSELQKYLKTYLPLNYFNSLENEEGTLIDDIKKYPLHYQKIIGLIRSIIGNKEIIILDEPFTNLSKYNQNLIENELLKLNKTIIILSKNPPMLKNYDKILLLENNLVKEEGTYEELEKEKRDFYRLINP